MYVIRSVIVYIVLGICSVTGLHSKYFLNIIYYIVLGLLSHLAYLDLWNKFIYEIEIGRGMKIWECTVVRWCHDDTVRMFFTVS